MLIIMEKKEVQTNKQDTSNTETGNKPEVKNISNNDLKLRINIALVEKGGNTPVIIDQEITLPGLLLPSFLKGAYTQVENTLNTVGVEMFKALAKQYFFNKINKTFMNLNDTKSLNYEQGVLYNDEKRLVAENQEIIPDDSLLSDAINNNGNNNTIELEVETEPNK